MRPSLAGPEFNLPGGEDEMRPEACFIFFICSRIKAGQGTALMQGQMWVLLSAGFGFDSLAGRRGRRPCLDEHQQE